MRGLQDGHEILPRPGTARSTGSLNEGNPAQLTNPHHYPAEAICQCGEVIRSENFFDRWHHTGRKPGDPVR